MYLLITVILIAVTVFFVVFPKLRKFRERNSILTTFIITLVATGAGVFLALYFSNIEEKNKEKDNAVKILSASYAELGGNIGRVMTALGELERIDDTAYTFGHYIEMYKIEKEFNFRNVMDNDIVTRNLSPEGVFLYSLWNDNVLYAFKQLNNSIGKGKLAYAEALVIYWEHLEVIRRIIDLEQKYIQGKVAVKDMSLKYNEIQTDFTEGKMLMNPKD